MSLRRRCIGGCKGAGGSRIGIVLRDFFLQLLAQRFQFALGQAKRVNIVAQHAFGSLLHAAFNLVNVPVRALFKLAGLRQEAALHEFGGEIERFIQLFLVALAQGVVKLLGQERLGDLGLLGNAAHLVE